MRFRQFLSLVPKAVQWWALVIACCMVPIGLVVGYFTPGAGLRTMATDGAAGLFAGILIPAWLLGLGFVFADARRRGMPPISWTLVAMFLPNLLGFLLYFVMRKPLTVECPGCRRAIPAEQPFCSWCGSSQSRPPSGDTRSPFASSRLDPINLGRLDDAS